MQNNLKSLLNDVSEIKNTLNDIKALLMNTKTKTNAQKPLKTAINDSLFLNATSKINNATPKDYLFDLSKIEYCEGSLITTKELSSAINIKNFPVNVLSRDFKQTSFYTENNITPYRDAKSRGFRNIRLRLDTSNQQS